MIRKIRQVLITILFVCGFPFILNAQDLVGVPFLKVGLGARQAGMGGAFTGVADDAYSLFWNPGGIGHIRQWQWAVSYNRYFTDISQASVAMARQFRALGSRKTGIGLSCAYMGMPEWDSTDGTQNIPVVSAGNFVAGLTIGQRAEWLHKSISYGFTIKGIQSRLANYTARGWAGDVGILIRPGRIRLKELSFGIFDYGVMTFGAAVSHIGPEIQFDKEGTLLPMTYRAGFSYLMGRYDGWSVMVAADAMQPINHDWIYACGGEVWFKNILGLRGGYRFNGEDLRDLSLGIGFRWEDAMRNMLNLPTRFADAFELNFADVSYGEVLDQTYRGTLSYYSIAPEPFLMEEAVEVDSDSIIQQGNQVQITWEKTIDPDPFDDVGYVLVIDQDPLKVQESIKQLERDMPSFLSSPLCHSLTLFEQVPITEYTFLPTEGGVYHWAVAAYDLAFHAQLAKKGREEVRTFIVAVPDLHVKEITFSPTPWITTTPEQGLLRVEVANAGTAAVDSFRLIVTEGYNRVNPLKEVIISRLAFDEDTTIVFQWRTLARGLRPIQVIVDPDSAVLELDETNNIFTTHFFTVPKGVLAVPDTIEVMATGYDSTDIPVVPEIYFEAFSDTIDSFFFTPQYMESTLEIVTSRLRAHPEVTMELLGSIDALSLETDEKLAEERAFKVRDKLVNMGVPPSQLRVVRDHPDKVLGRQPMPANPQDAEWVMQHHRKVAFQTEQIHEEALFEPIRVAVDTTLTDSVQFGFRIDCPSVVHSWILDDPRDSVLVTQVDTTFQDSLWHDYFWNGTDREKVVVPRDHWYKYQLTLTDTLGRMFFTRLDSVFLREKRTLRRKELFGAAKFAKVEPVYQFYWERMMDIAREVVENPNMHIRFEGHACATGPTELNQNLSQRRAEAFTQAFLRRLKSAYPAQYENILTRISSPIGFGEKEPLRVKLRDVGEVQLGVNATPHGRYLNRRISVLLYREN
ncbi:PorV/PorQ family protein [candidate division KSB1 bacterium]|nr:PorV/PorQ family protein [candidate division KSB1 bacterium]